MKLLRADLRSSNDSLELLKIRNLETARQWTNDPHSIIDAKTHLSYVERRMGVTPSEDRMLAYFVKTDGDDATMGYQRFDIDPDNPKSWFISTAFRPSAQGKGFGTRSTKEGILQLRVDLSKTGRSLAHVYAWIHSENTPSIKMFARCGFVPTERQMTDKAGQSMDLYVYTLPRTPSA